MKRNKINWRVPKGMELTELDKKVLYYQDRGHLVPSRELIKTPEQIEGIRRSGIVNTGVLDLVEREIHAGVKLVKKKHPWKQQRQKRQPRQRKQ